jgi:hypothetical protein
VVMAPARAPAYMLAAAIVAAALVQPGAADITPPPQPPWANVEAGWAQGVEASLAVGWTAVVALLVRLVATLKERARSDEEDTLFLLEKAVEEGVPPDTELDAEDEPGGAVAIIGLVAQGAPAAPAPTPAPDLPSGALRRHLKDVAFANQPPKERAAATVRVLEHAFVMTQRARRASEAPAATVEPDADVVSMPGEFQDLLQILCSPALPSRATAAMTATLREMGASLTTLETQATPDFTSVLQSFESMWRLAERTIAAEVEKAERSHYARTLIKPTRSWCGSYTCERRGKTCAPCIVKRAELDGEARVKAAYESRITKAWEAAVRPIVLAAARICAERTAKQVAAGGDEATPDQQATTAARWAEVDSLLAEQAEEVQAVRSDARMRPPAAARGREAAKDAEAWAEALAAKRAAEEAWAEALAAKRAAKEAEARAEALAARAEVQANVEQARAAREGGEPAPEPEPEPELSLRDEMLRDAIEYFCGLSFVHETDDGPSDETNLLVMREKYAAGELAGSTLVWTEDFDDWMPLDEVLKDVWAEGVDAEAALTAAAAGAGAAEVAAAAAAAVAAVCAARAVPEPEPEPEHPE